MKKHSLTINGHRTSISLEDEFWQRLKKIAQELNVPLVDIVKDIDCSRKCGLSSAIRVFVFNYYVK